MPSDNPIGTGAGPRPATDRAESTDASSGAFGTLSVRSSRGWAQKSIHLLTLVAWMVGAAIVIPVTMISLGLLLGPRGYEGVVLAPLTVLASWALILFFGLRRKVTPRQVQKSRVAQLPPLVAALLEQEQRLFPPASSRSIEHIHEKLLELAPGLEGLPEDHPQAGRLRRLLVEDLGGLLENYQKLPVDLRAKALHGGPSPEEQLTEGLSTIEEELCRVQEDLSKDHLFALATQQRYLELKYGKAKGKGS